jgi:tubulin-specific chaperone A
MPPKAAPSADKKLKVQTSVVKRMLKEVAAYEKEVVDNEARVQKMRDDGKDEYDIRKQEEVLAESHMMVPDSKGRLETAVQALRSCIEEVNDEGDADAATLTEASAILDEALLKTGA